MHSVFDNLRKCVYNALCPSDVNNIDKIIFNKPCTILIDKIGKKTIVRTQENDQFDRHLGYYLVIAKYLANSKTYSYLLSCLFPREDLDLSDDYKEIEIRKELLIEMFLLGILGHDMFESVIDASYDDSIFPMSDELEENYTVYFQEVLNDEC